MGTKSSGHLKKSKGWNIWHNTDIRPSYAIGGVLEFNHNAQEALVLKQEIIKKAKEAYARTKKPKAPPFKAQNYEWSLVVNLKESSTMQDLDKLAEFFVQKYGFQCYQIAIHRDEGHIDEQGNKQINHHAHLEFISLDKETGKNRSRDIWNNHKKMSEMQDDIAQILQMEREPYQKGKAKAKRIEPRALAAIKEQEKQQKAQLVQNLTPKEISEICESFRKSKKNLGYPKEFFRELSTIKKDTKESSKQELEILLDDLAKNYELQRQINQNLQEQQDKGKEKELLENKLIEQQKEINLLKEENKELKELFSIAMQKFWAQFPNFDTTKIKSYFKEDLTSYAMRFTQSVQTALQNIFKSTEMTTQIPQPRVSRVKDILAGTFKKPQEPAQQGQNNTIKLINTQTTHKPKSRRR